MNTIKTIKTKNLSLKNKRRKKIHYKIQSFHNSDLVVCYLTSKRIRYKVDKSSQGMKLVHITGTNNQDSSQRKFHIGLSILCNECYCVQCGIKLKEFASSHVREEGTQNVFLITTCDRCNIRGGTFNCKYAFWITYTGRKRIEYES